MQLYFILGLLFISSVYTQIIPKLDKFHREKIHNVGGKFKQWCGILDGSKPLRFEWRKNGQPLAQIMANYHYHIDNVDDDSSILVIDKLSSNDSGNYSCHVSNQFGSDIQSTILTVKGLCLCVFLIILFRSQYVAHISTSLN